MHGAEIVVTPVALDAQAAVLRLVRLPVAERHRGGDRLTPLRVRDVEAHHEPRHRGQLKRLLQLVSPTLDDLPEDGAVVPSIVTHADLASLCGGSRENVTRILSDFQRLVRLDLGRHTARVESATPLAGPLRGAIEANLAGRYGSHLTTVFHDDPGLIGGVRIRVGSDVFDGTIRRRLDGLAGRL